VRLLPPEAEILTFAVDPDFRRQGHGRKLLTAVFALLRDAGVESAFLEVRADNHAARALYGSAGFVEAGRRTGYHSGEEVVMDEAKYKEFEERILSAETRWAFRYLVVFGHSSRELDLEFRDFVTKKVCNFYYKGQRRLPPYAFIVNRDSPLLFYFRLPGVRRDENGLRRDFGNDFNNNSNSQGEWTVKLQTLADAKLLAAKHVPEFTA